MTRTLILLILLLTLKSFAQPKKKKKPEVHHDGASFDVVIGHKTFKNSFYNQFSDLNSVNFSKPIDLIGINVSTGQHPINPRRAISVNLSYNYFIPRSVSIQDSISAKINGFSINWGAGKTFLSSKGTVSLGAFIGLNSGLLRVTSDNGSSQGNGFVSPKIALQPKIILFNIAVSIIFEYEYDLTKPTWKKMTSGNDDSFQLIGFNQSGLNTFLTIGYALN